MIKASRFSVCLVFFAFCLFIASAQTQTLLYCNVTNPNRTQACAYIFDPVCANYPTNCTTPPCSQVKDFINDCLACADSNVESYIVGPCLVGDITSGQEIAETENAESGEAEGEGEGEGEGEAGENGENGVSLEDIILSEGGVFCNVTAGATVSCATDLDPVCGFMKRQDVGTTLANSCVACYEEGVDYYFPGSCPDEETLSLLF